MCKSSKRQGQVLEEDIPHTFYFNSTSLFSDNHVKDGAIEKRDDGIMEQLGEISNEINELKLDLGE